jgi:hypothetical protein
MEDRMGKDATGDSMTRTTIRLNLMDIDEAENDIKRTDKLSNKMSKKKIQAD